MNSYDLVYETEKLHTATHFISLKPSEVKLVTLLSV